MVCFWARQYERTDSKSRMLRFSGPAWSQRSKVRQRNWPYCAGVIENSAILPVAGSVSTQGMN